MHKLTSSHLLCYLHTVSEIPTPLRTPLYEEHLRAGAKLIEFGGWEMPVFYSSIIEEHLAVRQNVGVFDISHMGQILISGPEAATFLNRVLTNQIAQLAIGRGQYSLLLNEKGGVIDDLLVYQIGPEQFFLVVNAAKIDEDHAWLVKQRIVGVEIANESENYGGLAVQGPHAVALLEGYLGRELPPRNGIIEVILDGIAILVARTGYTGEDGAEIFFPAPEAAQVWQKILSLGAKPAGLGARDTLRLEVCYPLNGSDLSPDRTPLEAGLGFFVDLDKPDLIGRDVLLAQKKSGIPSRLVPFRMTGKTPPPRAHYPVLIGGEVVGETSSGGLSPSLNQGIGLAYLPTDKAVAGTEIEIDIRGRRFPAVLAKKPLYKKS